MAVFLAARNGLADNSGIDEILEYLQRRLVQSRKQAVPENLMFSGTKFGHLRRPSLPEEAAPIADSRFVVVHIGWTLPTINLPVFASTLM